MISSKLSAVIIPAIGALVLGLAAKPAQAAIVVPLTGATASWSQQIPATVLDVSTAIDGNFGGATVLNGWAIHDQEGNDQHAVFQVSGSPFSLSPETLFTFDLYQNYGGGGHTIGKFKISVTTDPTPTATSGAVWHSLNNVTFADTSAETAANISLVDGTILLNPTTPDGSTYTVTGKTTLTGITGFRLDVLADPTLPSNGPGRQPVNGNFVLQEFTVAAVIVPEPSAMALGLMLFGGVGLMARARQRRRSNNVA